MGPIADQAPSPVPVEIAFLEDWRRDHRALSETHREAAGRYITAIVERDPRAQDDRRAERTLAIALWQQFRESYDGFVGPYMRSAQEDFGRALAHL